MSTTSSQQRCVTPVVGPAWAVCQTAHVSQTGVARRAWTLFEPIHAIVYFAPEARETYAAAGLRGGWMGYFASRSAPMGPVSADVVTAVFHNFQPAMVHRAIPDAWRFSTAERVLEARLAIADSALRRLWGDDTDAGDVTEAAEHVLDVASRLLADGRPLFAGHAGLSVPDTPHLALWHGCTLLREHRFDGHVAALTVHGIDGLAALLMAVAARNGVDARTLRSFRGWTDEEWSEGERRLRERGIIDRDGGLTPLVRSCAATSRRRPIASLPIHGSCPATAESGSSRCSPGWQRAWRDREAWCTPIRSVSAAPADPRRWVADELEAIWGIEWGEQPGVEGSDE